MELGRRGDGAAVGVFDLFLGYGVGAHGESVGGERCAITLRRRTSTRLAWLAITHRRPPIELYDSRTRQRLATGDRKLDRHHRVHCDEADAVSSVFAAPADLTWLREALTERYVDHRPISVLEIAMGWALIAAKASDFGHPDELALANPRLQFGPWPDEMLARLLALRALTASAGPG